MRARPLRFARELALAGLGFALGSALVRAFVPAAEGGALDLKLAYLRVHVEEYDALFLGSSRVHEGVVPRVFDDELARAGLACRSFNAGAGGLHPFEQDWALQRVLALAPRRLRWIFLEIGPVAHTAAGADPLDDPWLDTARGAQWHTLRETALVLAAVWRAPLGPLRRLELARKHLELFGARSSGLARGPDALARVGRDHLALAERTFASRRWSEGFKDLEAFPEVTDGRRELLADPAALRARVARIPAENRRAVRTAELPLELFRAAERGARARGIELVWFTMPGIEGVPEALRLAEAGELPTLLHFDDPERYPELFEPEQRYDEGHLDRSGAERLSRALAQAFLMHVDTRAGG